MITGRKYAGELWRIKHRWGTFDIELLHDVEPATVWVQYHEVVNGKCVCSGVMRHACITWLDCLIWRGSYDLMKGSRHDPAWLNLHPLWLALSRAGVPHSHWVDWNRYARQNGVERALRALERQGREEAEGQGEQER